MNLQKHKELINELTLLLDMDIPFMESIIKERTGEEVSTLELVDYLQENDLYKRIEDNRITVKQYDDWNKINRIAKAWNEGKLILQRYADGTKSLINNPSYKW